MFHDATIYLCIYLLYILLNHSLFTEAKSLVGSTQNSGFNNYLKIYLDNKVWGWAIVYYLKVTSRLN